MGYNELSINSYRDSVQKTGDEFSRIIFGRYASKTLGHQGVKVLTAGEKDAVVTTGIPEGYVGVAHSATGDADLSGSGQYAQSVMENLLFDAHRIRAKPWAFCCDIDAHDLTPPLAHTLGKVFLAYALRNDFAYLNGESAKLGSRRRGDDALHRQEAGRGEGRSARQAFHHRRFARQALHERRRRRHQARFHRAPLPGHGPSRRLGRAGLRRHEG
jgi:hypothetical protein